MQLVAAATATGLPALRLHSGNVTLTAACNGQTRWSQVDTKEARRSGSTCSQLATPEPYYPITLAPLQRRNGNNTISGRA
jgi:hypothetical protein